MNTEQILLKTQQQIKKYQSEGRRNRYPQSIKEAIATLSLQISGPQLAAKLGISKSFIYRCSNDYSNAEVKSRPSSKDISVNNIQLQDITHQLKSFVKEKNPTITPSMKLTTSSGIIVEIF